MKNCKLCLLLTVLFTSAVAIGADEPVPSATSARFEALKKLAGDWVAVGKDGKPTDKVISSIRVTAAGTVVQETHFPGSDHEMVTMYHRDGADLVLTHYCMLGNQPRMRAEAGKADQIVFKFTNGGNIEPARDHYMNQVTITILGADHYKAEWLSSKEGKTCHKVDLDLIRKTK
jgi:hypothetical protein